MYDPNNLEEDPFEYFKSDKFACHENCSSEEPEEDPEPVVVDPLLQEMLEKRRREHAEFMKKLRELQSDPTSNYQKGLFVPIDGSPKLTTGGIDGFESMPITKKALFKFIEKRLGKDPEKACKLITTGNPFYSTLKQKAEKERKWVTRKIRKGGAIQETKFYKLDIGCNEITAIVTEFDSELMTLAKNNKKKHDTYVKVSFQGLYQPTKLLNQEGCNAYAKFLKRFPIANIDLAADAKKGELSIESRKELMGKIIAFRYDTKGVVPTVPKLASSADETVYFNFVRTEENKDYKAPDFLSFLMYSKSLKQKLVHHQKIKSEFNEWHRIEIKVPVGGKFLKSSDIIKRHMDLFARILNENFVLSGREVRTEYFTFYAQQLKAIKSSKGFKTHIYPDRALLDEESLEEYNKFYEELYNSNPKIIQDAIIHRLAA